ncbi:MAG: metallophosphoesterase [Burkholderiales bacterium]|nr:metallophosphoesterase [Bacteroidia bacterium]
MNRSNRIIPIILFLITVTFLMDWYSYQGIKIASAGINNTVLLSLLRFSYWFLFFGFTFLLSVRIYFAGISPGKPGITESLFSIFITLFISNFVFTAILFTEDIFRILVYLWNGITTHSGDRSGSLMPPRQEWVSKGGIMIAGFCLLSFLYGITKGKHRYKLHKHTLYFNDLPPAFDGFTIAQISDIHSGSFKNSREVQKGIDMVKAQQPDLFVFTGDLVNNIASEIEPYIKQFNQIKAPYGQFSILGNHDYGDYTQWPSQLHKEQNLEQLKQHHRSMEYRLLLDEHVTIQKGDEKITLLGVNNWGKGFGERGDLNKALQNTTENGFKILLSHDPSHWDEVIKKHPSLIHLTLSGHTHGMQVGIELPFFKWSPVKWRYANWSGLAIENGRNLYVNRGFGFIGFLGRVGIWPEVTLIELKKK